MPLLSDKIKPKLEVSLSDNPVISFELTAVGALAD